ncbi:molybdopterin molybdotransferase MoeA [Diaminobutyricibacter tongyongensis]|uniref:Molybdopterin molybdenumtransferase n=1 Tax=Leifsonia tongyongensis TaxID=1268043 RepID=A0A6L9Y1B2_9MICO|nr:gephyrin-like molybdotransferase Glp [Diaminobutyricibacter tongyongensis]NEN07481.1 molybdopterin molybdotransferase MoeA [Diaminobutyricibacter tongyongensis]
MTPAVTVEEHARRIEQLLAPVIESLGAEPVPLASALGCLTVANIRSDVDLPLFRNSQMDGFAVRAIDVASAPIALEVTGDIPAGHAAPVALIAGTALRIMTGAPMPTGADTVIPVEDTELVLGRDDALEGAIVTVARARSAGEFVRERGSDLRRGDLLLPAGTRLAPRHLAALAAAGVSHVDVRRRLRVGVITTGAELVADDEELALGRIFDANRIALAAGIAETGAIVSIATSSDDDPVTFRRVLDEVIGASDLVITSGGVSKGAFEVVREVLEPLGASVGSVAMQPGGPQGTAVVDSVPVVCFPGNPVSTQVSFAVFLAPILRRVAGLPARSAETRTLASPVQSVAGKRQFLRGVASDDGTVALVSGPSSHLVAAMARADVLIDIPVETTRLEAGESVAVWML